MEECIFCDIAQGKARAKVIYENDNYIVFENINPKAPVHVLVVPKKHLEKVETRDGKHEGFWDEIMEIVNIILRQYKLDKTGYRLVINGAGYNHIEHEHIHVLGGESWEPQDDL